MNDVRNLKIALVSVFVVAAGFLGLSSHKNNQLESKIEAFSSNIQSVRTETEAKQEISAFLSSTQPGRSLALTSSANEGSDGSGNAPWCEYMNIPFMNDCPNKKKSDNTNGGSGSTGSTNNGSNYVLPWYFTGGYEQDIFEGGTGAGGGSGSGSGSGTGSAGNTTGDEEICEQRYNKPC